MVNLEMIISPSSSLYHYHLPLSLSLSFAFSPNTPSSANPSSLSTFLFSLIHPPHSPTPLPPHALSLASLFCVLALLSFFGRILGSSCSRPWVFKFPRPSSIEEAAE